MIHAVEVYFDGTVGPNEPAEVGSWAYAVIINDGLAKRDSGLVRGAGPYRVMQMNYHALEQALHYLLENDLVRQHVRFQGDDLDQIRQLCGEWEIPDGVAHEYARVVNLVRKFRDVGFNYITKKRNDLAANAAERELVDAGITPLRLSLRKKKEESNKSA